jgi:hypothetical protein
MTPVPKVIVRRVSVRLHGRGAPRGLTVERDAGL